MTQEESFKILVQEAVESLEKLCSHSYYGLKSVDSKPRLFNKNRPYSTPQSALSSLLDLLLFLDEE